MKQILLLLLVVFFVGCNKDDESENDRIAGKWMLYEYREGDEFNECNRDGLIDEFYEDGKYFGILLNDGSAVKSNGIYSLKGDELKINKTIFKVLYLSEPQLILERISGISGIVYYLSKPL